MTYMGLSRYLLTTHLIPNLSEILGKPKIVSHRLRINLVNKLGVYHFLSKLEFCLKLPYSNAKGKIEIVLIPILCK